MESVIMGNYHIAFGNRLSTARQDLKFHIFSWLATLWGSSIELKAPSLFALGFIFLFSANLVCGSRLLSSLRAGSTILLYAEFGSPLRQLNGSIVMTVGFRKAPGNYLVGRVNTRKDMLNSLKPSIATCPGLIGANCIIHLTSIRYNLSDTSVRKYHTPGTSASDSQLDDVTKASKLVPMIIKPTSQELILYNSTSLQIIKSDKALNLCKYTGEKRKTLLKNLHKREIESASAKAKNGHKRGSSNLVSPKNLPNAQVQLKINLGTLSHGATNETLNSIEDLWFKETGSTTQTFKYTTNVGCIKKDQEKIRLLL